MQIQKSLTDYENPRSLGSRMRARRLGPLKELIESVHESKEVVKILDVGGRKTYWDALGRDFLENHAVTVTILNLPIELKGVDDAVFTHVAGDACNMPQYADNSFDIVHSNSVIEHVGNWQKIKSFAAEVSRIAPNLFVQTPYFWFPIEPHYVKPLHHWLPRPFRARMFQYFQMGQYRPARSLDEALQWVDEEPFLLDVKTFQLLFPDCELIRERFMLLTKSMIAFRRSCSTDTPRHAGV